jgi:type I restriction enzyme S subunit
MIDWKICKLSEISDIITEKTEINNASKENYISTENMISNFGGVIQSSSLPNTKYINCFCKNDILFSNIRTYFKKVWFSNFSGTVSPDVLVFRAKNCYSKYLYYSLCSPVFTEYSLLTSKGAKCHVEIRMLC